MCISCLVSLLVNKNKKKQRTGFESFGECLPNTVSKLAAHRENRNGTRYVYKYYKYYKYKPDQYSNEIRQ